MAERIFQTLLDRIYRGDLQPGSLVNEAALALEWGISRGPVREAIRRLQGIQLITREPYLKARVCSLNSETAQELFEMRMALEGVACKLAAERMDKAAIKSLFTELESDRQVRLQPRQRSGGEPRVFDLHERIVRGSGNKRIIELLCSDLYHLLRLYRRRSGALPERGDDAYTEHWQIVRALEARDGRLAESLMRSHIERAAAHLFTKLPPAADPPGQASPAPRAP